METSQEQTLSGAQFTEMRSRKRVKKEGREEREKHSTVELEYATGISSLHITIHDDDPHLLDDASRTLSLDLLILSFLHSNLRVEKRMVVTKQAERNFSTAHTPTPYPHQVRV